ncbi:hypothetical protein ACFL5Z_02640 [Planctomycetota bacterium]
METTKRLTILLIVAVMASGPIQATEPSKAKLSDTYMASCLVKVNCNPVVLPLSFETIDYLLHSSGVGGKAARSALDVSPDQVQDLFTIEYVHELTSKADQKSSMGRSSGPQEGMDEYEYAMMMEGEMERPMMGPSARSSRGRGSSGRTRRTPRTPRTITTSAFPTDEKTYLFSLHIELPEDFKPAAEEFMDALVLNLRYALKSTFDEHRQKLRRQDAIADEEAVRAEHELSNQQNRLRAISGSRILDGNRILMDIEGLRNNIQEIRMEQDSDRVTLEVTMEQIAKIQAKMQKEIGEDTVTQELNELLKLQQQSFQNVERLYQNGSASAADLADAQEKLARSRIELAQRREQLSKSAGGNRIESLNSALANYSMEDTLNRMKLKSLDEQLAEAEDLLGKADDYEMLSLKVDIAKQNLQETILWRDRMSRQIRMIQPPMISVIGGD